MSRPDDDLMQRLRAVLSRALPSGYPLPPGESEADWRAAALAALEQLAPALSQPAGFDHTLGSALDLTASAEMPQSLEALPGRARLLGEVLRNLADPGRINQGHKGTCAVACVEIHLAMKHPGVYARLVAELLSMDGAARMNGGAVLTRDESQLQWTAAEARRSPASRLLQVAFMEFAFPDLDYCNIVDGHHDGDGTNTGTGMSLDAFDRLLDAVTGHAWSRLCIEDRFIVEQFVRMGMCPTVLPDIKRDGEAIIRASLAADHGVFVTLQPLPESGRRATPDGLHPMLRLPHKVRVLRIDDGAGRIWYDDPLDPEVPWIPDVESRVENLDGHCSMAKSDFLGLVVELSCRTEHVPKT